MGVKHVAVFLDDLTPQLARAAAGLRELVLPGEGPHGVEDRAAVGVILVVALVQRHARVEGRAPGAVHNLDVPGRIDARLHRPQHLLEVAGIDVLVYDHHQPAVAGDGVEAQHGHAGLLGVAGVALPDGHHDEVAAVDPHAGDVLDAGAFQLVPQQRGLEVEAHLLGARPQRRHAHDDRVVTVIQRLDADDRLLFAGAARPA